VTSYRLRNVRVLDVLNGLKWRRQSTCTALRVARITHTHWHSLTLGRRWKQLPLKWPVDSLYLSLSFATRSCTDSYCALRCVAERRKDKGKGHTLNIAPLSEETSLQKRSGMARIVEGFHSFTCTPARLSTNGTNHTCLCLPNADLHLVTPERWKAELA